MGVGVQRTPLTTRLQSASTGLPAVLLGPSMEYISHSASTVSPTLRARNHSFHVRFRSCESTRGIWSCAPCAPIRPSKCEGDPALSDSYVDSVTAFACNETRYSPFEAQPLPDILLFRPDGIGGVIGADFLDEVLAYAVHLLRTWPLPGFLWLPLAPRRSRGRYKRLPERAGSQGWGRVGISGSRSAARHREKQQGNHDNEHCCQEDLEAASCRAAGRSGLARGGRPPCRRPRGGDCPSGRDGGWRRLWACPCALFLAFRALADVEVGVAEAGRYRPGRPYRVPGTGLARLGWLASSRLG